MFAFQKRQLFGRGRQIGCHKEKGLQAHDFEGPGDRAGRRQKDEPGADQFQFLLKVDQQTDSRAIDRTDSSKVEEAMTTVRGGLAREVSAGPDSLYVKPIGRLDALAGRIRQKWGAILPSATAARPGLKLPPLGKNPKTENPKIFKVPAKKPARFLEETEHPFQTVALHPKRRPCDAAGEEVNGRADPHAHRDSQLAVVHRNPFFLFRTAQTDEKQIRSCFRNATLDLVVVHLQQFAEWRRIKAGDSKVGVIDL